MSADILLGVPGRLKQILDRLTAGRASNLDRVDATVSSRATQTSVNSVNNAVGTVNSRLTAARAAKLDNVAVTPKCFILDVHKSWTNANYQIPLGYTAKTFSKVAVIPHVFGHKSTGEMYPAIAALTSTRNNIHIATPLRGQSLYFYGMVTIIDFYP
jgi:hypothetical protein